MSEQQSEDPSVSPHLGTGFAFFYWTRYELNHDDGWKCAGCRWEWALMEEKKAAAERAKECR